jgi:hypothetical protein
VSNPTYGQGSEERASDESSAAGVPDPYASDQKVSSDLYATDQTVSSDPYATDQTVSPDPYATDQTVSPDPYATDQTVVSDAYTDEVPPQPADVSYGTVGDSSGDSGGSRLSSAKDTAKGEAGAVKDTAVDAGRNVAGTAREQAANVTAEAKGQAKNLLGTVSEEVRNQGRAQQSRLAEAVHSVSKELGSMGAKSEESGPVSDLAQQASRKGGEIAHWLETKEPADLLEDVRSFARGRPAMFLGMCLLAGVVAGRLGRSAVAANTSLDSKEQSQPPRHGYDESSYAGTPASYDTTVSDTGYATGYETGYSGMGDLGGEGTGRSMGGYAAGSMPESGSTYPGDQGLQQPPYGGQGDLNR